MGRQPGTEVVMITNAMPLAERNGRAVRDIMQTTGYQRIFGTTVSPSLSAAASFSATNGASSSASALPVRYLVGAENGSSSTIPFPATKKRTP